MRGRPIGVGRNYTSARARENAQLGREDDVKKRWQDLVGCQPAADLSDACVATFIENFGKEAFRRDLVDEELQQYLKVARDAAVAGGSAELGLSTALVGMLQSPNFLYRVERNALDVYNFVSDPKNLPKWASGLGAAARETGRQYDIDVFVRKMERLYQLLHQVSRPSHRRGVLAADLAFLTAR